MHTRTLKSLILDYTMYIMEYIVSFQDIPSLLSSRLNFIRPSLVIYEKSWQGKNHCDITDYGSIGLAGNTKAWLFIDSI